MKRIGLMIACALVALVGVVNADWYDAVYTATITGENVAVTNGYTLRGKLEAVVIDIPAANATFGACTNMVTITAASGETLFLRGTNTADGVYRPRFATHNLNGTAITFLAGSNNAANTWYERAALGSKITCVTKGMSAGTNTYTTTLIFER